MTDGHVTFDDNQNVWHIDGQVRNAVENGEEPATEDELVDPGQVVECALDEQQQVYDDQRQKGQVSWLPKLPNANEDERSKSTDWHPQENHRQLEISGQRLAEHWNRRVPVVQLSNSDKRNERNPWQSFVIL